MLVRSESSEINSWSAWDLAGVPAFTRLWSPRGGEPLPFPPSLPPWIQQQQKWGDKPQWYSAMFSNSSWAQGLSSAPLFSPADEFRRAGRRNRKGKQKQCSSAGHWNCVQVGALARPHVSQQHRQGGLEPCCCTSPPMNLLLHTYIDAYIHTYIRTRRRNLVWTGYLVVALPYFWFRYLNIIVTFSLAFFFIYT